MLVAVLVGGAFGQLHHLAAIADEQSDCILDEGVVGIGEAVEREGVAIKETAQVLLEGVELLQPLRHHLN